MVHMLCEMITGILVFAVIGLCTSQFPQESAITGNTTNSGLGQNRTSQTVINGNFGGGFPMIGQLPVHHPQVIHFIGAGYNLPRGNPDGESWTSSGDDPGLKITRKMLAVSPGENPPEIEIEHRDSCQSSHSYNLVYNTQTYQDRLMSAIQTSANGQGNTDDWLKYYSFTLSTGFQTAVHQLAPPVNYVFQDYTTTCDMGHARLRTDRLSVSPEFAAAICSLPDTYQHLNYMNFLDRWGTHVITEVEVGKKLTYRYQTTLDKYFSFLLVNATQDVKRSVGQNVSSDYLTLDLDTFQYRKEYRYLVGTYHDTYGVGNPQYNDEIELVIMSIDLLLDPKYWSNMSYFVSQGICYHNASQVLPKYKSMMFNALHYYIGHNRAPKPTAGRLQVPLVWPAGKYSLQKPVSGCPGSFNWSQGRVTTNMSMAQSSSMSSFDGDIESTTYTLTYCTKERQESPYELLWPKGDYCILNDDDSCPQGFSDSSIRYQDGINVKSVGVTPFMEHSSGGIKQHFCCRSDNSYLTPMFLPTAKPFYLIKNNGGCQRVDGMKVTEQHFLYPTKHTVFVYNAPSHTTIRGQGVRLDYCYYEQVKIEVGGGIG